MDDKDDVKQIQFMIRKITNKEQDEHIRNLLKQSKSLHSFIVLEDGLVLDGMLSFDDMAVIVDYLKVATPQWELFEECWIAYNRKGSKKRAFEQWKKLSDDEKSCVMPHIKAYVSCRERQYQKDFERYLRDKTFYDIVSKGNTIVYDPARYTSHTYMPQGRSIWYEESTQSYWSLDSFYDEKIYDGFTDDERPDGAEITLNNARGTYKWNSHNRKWEKKK